MKKFLGIISLVIAIMFSFAACNNNTQVENNNKENNNSVVQNNNSTAGNKENVADQNQEGGIVDISSLYSGEIITEPFNKTFEVTSSLDNIASVSGLKATTKLTEEQIKEKFKFGNFAELQKEIRSEVTEDSIKEIVIVKVGENDQSMVLFQILTARLADLRVEHKDNEKILAILDNSENLVMKQQGGILISILAENAKEISDELDKQF